MKRLLNHTLAADLENELKDSFSDVSLTDMNLSDVTVDEFIDQLARKLNLEREQVAQMVEKKINYIYSKRLG